MDVDSFRALLVPDGDARHAVGVALAALDGGADTLAASTRVRRAFPELAPDIASAAVGQATLRRRAREKFGPDADQLWFTAQGLEQATRVEVARHRASRFARLEQRLGHPPRVADLCCGIGGDLLALVGAGCEVTGVDRDPLTIEVARANVSHAHLARANLARATASTPQSARARVECLDVETFDASGYDAVFLDPSRRSGSHRTFDVRAYSPPWPFVLSVVTKTAAVKVAPGIAHSLIPPDVEAEWVSYRGSLKEAVLWSGALADATAARRATVLPNDVSLLSASRDDEGAPVGDGPRRYLYEPDDAVVRAHLIRELADIVDGVLLDPTTAYLTSDTLVDTPFAQRFEITDVLPFSLRRLRSLLRDRHVGAVTVMKRGSAVNVDQLRRDLRLSGDAHAVVVLALVAGKHHALIAQPVTPA